MIQASRPVIVTRVKENGGWKMENVCLWEDTMLSGCSNHLASIIKFTFNPGEFMVTK